MFIIFSITIDNKKIITLNDTNPLDNPNHHCIGFGATKGVEIKNVRIFFRKSRIIPKQLPGKTVDLKFHHVPNRIFEASLGSLSLYNEPARYVYLKDVTTSRQLLDQLKSNMRELENDLDFAKTIQMQIANVKIPKSSNIDFSYHYEPSGKVGGDMLGIRQLGKNKFGLIIYDVSGHGIAAALVSSMAKTLFDNAILLSVN